MRPLRPLFRRSAPRDEAERQAERLRNRDWVEILRVIHPSQAEAAQQEYMLSRLRSDWSDLVSPLLAAHSQPAQLQYRQLTVLCDHNTFANELSLVASVVEKKILDRYGISLRVQAKATRRLQWKEDAQADQAKNPTPPAGRKTSSPGWDKLIQEMAELEKSPPGD